MRIVKGLRLSSLIYNIRYFGIGGLKWWVIDLKHYHADRDEKGYLDILKWDYYEGSNYGGSDIFSVPIRPYIERAKNEGRWWV